MIDGHFVAQVTSNDCYFPAFITGGERQARIPQNALGRILRIAAAHVAHHVAQLDHEPLGQALPDALDPPQLRGIVGLRLRIDSIEGKRKLSQNRPDADRLGAAEGVEAEGAPDVAAAMRDAGPS